MRRRRACTGTKAGCGEMLEILEFIFQDFTHWFGTLVLLLPFMFFRLVEVTVERQDGDKK